MLYFQEGTQSLKEMGTIIKRIEVRTFLDILKKLLDDNMGFFDWIEIQFGPGTFINTFAGGKLVKVDARQFIIAKGHAQLAIEHKLIEDITLTKSSVEILIKGRVVFNLNFGKREMLPYFE